MDYISEAEHKELIDILDELIKTISLLRNSNSDYILVQNENEAREWMVFLKEHKDKEATNYCYNCKVYRLIIYSFFS